MKPQHHIIYLLSLLLLLLSGCVSDSLTTQPVTLSFSTDTLRLGDVWTGELSPTATLRVYNPASKGVTLSAVEVVGADADGVVLNIDGSSTFSPLDIRGSDSIFILAAVNLSSPGSVDAALRLTVNGQVSQLPISATAVEAQTLTSPHFARSATLSGNVRIFGELTVGEGAELTLAPGTTLWMHSGAGITLSPLSSLTSEATPEQPVVIRGDRTGFVAADIPYTVMSGQWRGITLASHSSLSATCLSVLNPEQGIALGEEATARLVNCRVSNSAASLITLAPGSSLLAAGCEFAEAADALLSFDDASAELYRCTLANNYLFAIPSSTLLAGTPREFTATASIIYSPGAELLPGFGGTFGQCLFGSKGSDDTSFISCLWATDPMFMLDLTTYTFDYRLDPASPARLQIGSEAVACGGAPGGCDYLVNPVRSAGKTKNYQLTTDRHGTPAPPIPTEVRVTH